jgi:hypothetical protein
VTYRLYLPKEWADSQRLQALALSCQQEAVAIGLEWGHPIRVADDDVPAPMAAKGLLPLPVMHQRIAVLTRVDMHSERSWRDVPGCRHEE